MAALLQKEKVFLIGFTWQKCHKVSENIGEFSRAYYSTWDEKCPAKSHDRLYLLQYETDWTDSS